MPEVTPKVKFLELANMACKGINTELSNLMDACDEYLKIVDMESNVEKQFVSDMKQSLSVIESLSSRIEKQILLWLGGIPMGLTHEEFDVAVLNELQLQMTMLFRFLSQRKINTSNFNQELLAWHITSMKVVNRYFLAHS